MKERRIICLAPTSLRLTKGSLTTQSTALQQYPYSLVFFGIL